MAQVADISSIRYCLEFSGGISDSLRSGIKSVQNVFTRTNRIDKPAKCTLNDRYIILVMMICKMLGLDIVDPDNKINHIVPDVISH